MPLQSNNHTEMMAGQKLGEKPIYYLGTANAWARDWELHDEMRRWGAKYKSGTNTDIRVVNWGNFKFSLIFIPENFAKPRNSFFLSCVGNTPEMERYRLGGQSARWGSRLAVRASIEAPGQRTGRFYCFLRHETKRIPTFPSLTHFYNIFEALGTLFFVFGWGCDIVEMELVFDRSTPSTPLPNALIVHGVFCLIYMWQVGRFSFRGGGEFGRPREGKLAHKGMCILIKLSKQRFSFSDACAIK